MRVLAPLLGLALLACQSARPDLPAASRPVSREVLERLRPGRAPEVSPGIAVIGEPDNAAPPGDAGELDALTLESVLGSVDEHFPLILAAVEEVEMAAARQLSAQGAFDTALVAKSKLQAQGFYETEQLNVELEQPTRFLGATVTTGYRLGTGDFAIWDGKLKTDEGGEFGIGLTVPLLQNRRIDARRAAEWQALIGVESARPLVQRKQLETTRKASESYWKWVAAGARRDLAALILDLAQTRQEQIVLAVEEGLLAPIAEQDNERLIVERRTKLLEEERKLQQAAIQLSLFARTSEGAPRVPLDSELPSRFPTPGPPQEILVDSDLDLAVERRPEVQGLLLELERVELDLELARNKVLPKLDVGVFASQDVGPTVNDPDDKGPFELAVGVDFRLPLQRRSPRGKVRELESKLRKAERELQFARDVVIAEVQDEVSSLQQSWLRIEQARENERLARVLREAEEIQVDAGESDLFRLNVREQQAALASRGLIDALEDYFQSSVRYATALGVNYSDVVRGVPSRGAELSPIDPRMR